MKVISRPIQKRSRAVLAIIGCLLGAAFLGSGQQWVQTTSLPDTYYGHSLAYWSGFLYNAGGSSGLIGEPDAVNVFYASVGGDGTIAKWNSTTPLPEPMLFHASVTANGFLYILGGDQYSDQYGLTPTNTVYSAKISGDGTIGSWQAQNSLPYSAADLSASVWQNRIYVLAGFDETSLLFSNVYSAEIQADGTLSSWVPRTPLPVRTGWQAAAVNGTLYVLGGITNSGGAVSGNLYYSSINTDGSLAGWRTGSLPQRLAAVGAIAARGRLFIAGGWIGSRATNSCYSSTVKGDGSLDSWSAGSPLPVDLYLFGTTASDTRIFVSGGNNASGNQKAVYSIALPPPPTAPALTARGIGTNGAFQLQVSSRTNTGFGLSASSDLATWTHIGWGFTDTNGSVVLQDTNAVSFPQRFYRAYWPLP